MTKQLEKQNIEGFGLILRHRSQKTKHARLEYFLTEKPEGQNIIISYIYFEIEKPEKRTWRIASTVLSQ